MAAHQAPCPWDSPGKNTGVGCHFLLQCMKMKSEYEDTQSCPTLRNPMDCSLPGSSAHGIFQARVLEWVAISFSNAWNRKVNMKSLSHVRLFATPWTATYQAPLSLGFSRQEHWSGLPFPSPMHENEKWKWSHSVMSDSSRPHGLQPTRLLRSWDFPDKSTGVGCHFLLQCMKLKSESEVTQSCPTLRDPMDCSLPGSSPWDFPGQSTGVGCHCLLLARQ